MTIPVVVEGATLEISGATGGSAIISSPPGNAKADGKGIYEGPIIIQVVGTTNGNCIQNAPAVGTIITTALHLLDNFPVVRENDSTGTIPILGNDSGSGAPCNYNATVQITNAGQTNVKSD